MQLNHGRNGVSVKVETLIVGATPSSPLEALIATKASLPQPIIISRGD